MEKVEFEWDKERRFEIEKVPPVYLLTALSMSIRSNLYEA
ncbi:hypothetical protein SNOG_03188 [Parastagonospora nodorum SN15]|uniref:Uncharacterized protein n=1 Tax=Phaeosphaeria nodorum (strain SN15 / ATCC MYA-4574 / FGSC 10173) TaxID=321614 RepID=Q0UYH6_PHANO|nr:hypothetical protein SNOG_03188 [Parastagonospora nodorum SN15]EAT89919.1 hypothetical protein SNOG_03188 [Parastagonospora nodorum SN15]